MTDERLLTPAQVVKILECAGIKRSLQWVYDTIECQELKATNLSSGAKRARWFISPSDLEKFLKNKENIE